MSLRIGVELPTRFDTIGEFLADGQAYEAAGADSLWLGDGMFRPVGDGTVMAPGLDPLTLLAALAAVTSRIRLGTSVLVAAQWPPALFAQVVTTLERVSRGRMVLGVGAGSEPVQLESNGVPFAERGARLDELIEAARRLWQGRTEPFDGRHYRLPGLRVAAAPRDGGPPILVGGSADAGLRRAVRLGAGFISAGGDTEQVRAEFERVRELGGGEDFELWAQVRAPENRAGWPELLGTYGELGATGLIVNHAPNLLDILRNPQEDDRQDLHMSVG